MHMPDVRLVRCLCSGLYIIQKVNHAVMFARSNAILLQDFSQNRILCQEFKISYTNDMKIKS